jgi:transcriptional regulator with PAS, ATPase and Fis domain
MREVYSVLEIVATSDAPVVIEGETGTGKELCAQAIHEAGARARGPFVVCDLAGISRSLIESELFGHVRGAFTGADRDRTGAFDAADGGTLFIDEIGELELELQPRLLRVLEKREIKPVGATQYRPIDVRVIVACNRDLEEERRAGRFREDLYFRLAVLRVKLPPLRERKEDLRPLVAKLIGGRAIEIAPIVWSLLAEYHWPGNVRELRTVIERALSALGDRTELGPECLGLAPAPATPQPVATDGELRSFHEAKEELINGWERNYLVELLRRARGNVSQAARSGGLDRPYLYRLMKKHKIISPEPT